MTADNSPEHQYKGPFHNGWLGIVAIPDQITLQVAAANARRYRVQLSKAGEDNEGDEDDELLNPDAQAVQRTSDFPLLTTPEARLHITLFQHKYFKNLPDEYARTMLRHLHTAFAGAPIYHEKFVVRHEQYLFMLTGGGDIRDAHRLVLGTKRQPELSQYVNQSAIYLLVAENSSVVSRGLMENLKRHGQMFVDRYYLPHMTLAFRDGDVPLPKYVPRKDSVSQRGIIDRFALTRHGTGGVITEIIAYSDRI